MSMKPNRLCRIRALVAITVASLMVAPLDTRADDAALAPREVPAKSIPVPTDVSPSMQKLIAMPLSPFQHMLLKTGEEWRKAAGQSAGTTLPAVLAMADRLHVKIEPS